MKKILLFAALIAATIGAKSQLHLQVGFGMACYNSAVGSEIELGYSIKRFVVAGAVSTSMRGNGTALQFKMGHRFCLENAGLQITGGYAYHPLNNELKGANKDSWAVSVHIIRKIKDRDEPIPIKNTAWYIGATASGQYLFVTFGGRYTFKKNK